MCSHAWCTQPSVHERTRRPLAEWPRSENWYQLLGQVAWGRPTTSTQHMSSHVAPNRIHGKMCYFTVDFQAASFILLRYVHTDSQVKIAFFNNALLIFESEVRGKITTLDSANIFQTFGEIGFLLVSVWHKRPNSLHSDSLEISQHFLRPLS